MKQVVIFRIVTPAGNYWGVSRMGNSSNWFIGTPTDSMDDGLYDKPIEIEFHGTFVVECLDPKLTIKCRGGP